MIDEATFAGAAESVRSARRFVVEAMSRDGVNQEQRDVVELAVSELATNAVRHARTAFTVEVGIDDDLVRVAVRDAGAGGPIPLETSPDAAEGRGLLVVGWLASEWGVDYHRRGKTVWFKLRRAR